MALLLIVACTLLTGAGGDGRMDDCCRVEDIAAPRKQQQAKHEKEELRAWGFQGKPA